MRDYGTDYRAVITWGAGGFGRIRTQDGEFLLETNNGISRLLDAAGSGRQMAPMGNDTIIPPAPPADMAMRQAQILAADQPVGSTQIDVMVMYTSGLAAKLGADGVRTRIEHLIALANQAYVDSQVNIQLRLVYTGMVNYTDLNNLSTALSDLSNGYGVFSGVASLRNQYGADLVTLLQQYYYPTSDHACGLGLLNGGDLHALTANSIFSVSADGDDLSGTSASYCSDYTLAHELGHSMGSAHDRAHAVDSNFVLHSGAFAYSYGYGIQGQFGTIMSYLSPGIGKFSNPAISCGTGLACGVSETDAANGANNALSLNNTRTLVGAFRPTSALDTTPDGFSFTPLEGVNPGDTLYSERFVVSGLTVAGAGGVATATGATAPISISGGVYSINGGAWTSSAGTVANGQSVQVRLVAASSAYGSATAMLSLGTLNRAFRVYTRPLSSSVVPSVVAAYDHGLALRADGVLYVWGNNDSGQLGNGGTTKNPVPSQVTSITNLSGIASTGSFTVALRSDGSVWTWGDNFSQQLRVSNATYVPTPTQVSGLSSIRQVASGLYASAALNTSGQVWEWGYMSALNQVSGISTATVVASGLSHRMALLANGTVLAWGDNSSGQIGVDGTSWAFSPTAVSGLSNVSAIAAGNDFNLALRSDGTVWAWGANDAGQLGDGSTTARSAPRQIAGLANVQGIAAGSNFGLARLADGTLKTWGNNGNGQLGDGTTTNRLSPVVALLSNVAAISAGPSNSMAMLVDGSVWSWGNNFFGQIGNGVSNAPSLSTPTRIGGTDWLIGAADLEPTGLNFGNASAAVGTWAESAAIAVAGINAATPVSITGGEYSIAGGAFTAANGSVLPGQTLALRALSPASGSSIATLTIGGIQATFSVSSAIPGVSLAPASLTFGALPQGSSSSLPLTLFNTGTASLSIGGILTTGDFSQGNNCGSSLAAAASCTISVSFTPTGNGNRSGSLSISDNAAGSPHTVSLSGNGELPGTAITANLVAGWNLLANSTSGTVNVTSVFGDATKVATVWKWQTGSSPGWAFYNPSLGDGGAQYASDKGYRFLTTLNPGEGFWVNARTAFSAGFGAGAAISSSRFADSPAGNALPSGWSLIAVGDNPTPRGFSNGIAVTPPASGAATSLNTLWAWYPGTGTSPPGWFFYSPTLDNSNGLSGYIASKAYLDFGTLGKTLDATTGFWVNHP